MKKITVIIAVLGIILVVVTASDRERNLKSYTMVSGLEQTDFSKHTIDLSKLYAGCPKRDCIPAINQPKFMESGVNFLGNEDMGIVMSHEGETRFYPYKILVWHEVVNDTIGDLHFSVTFCPLCGSGIVYDRKINGKIHRFGVSGTLYNSNLMMVDDLTHSLWSQTAGKCVVGTSLGAKLEPLEMQLLTYAQTVQSFPGMKILSTDTGHTRDYTQYPYGDYNLVDRLYFPVEENSGRFPAKELFYVFGLGDRSVAVQISVFRDGRYLKKIGGKNIVLHRDNGKVTVGTGGKVIPGYYEMWFSWFSTHGRTGTVWTKE